MAYEPKTWVCGEKITADDLNHIEKGIEDASRGGTEPLLMGYFTEDQNSGMLVDSAIPLWATPYELYEAVAKGETIEITLTDSTRAYLDSLGLQNAFQTIEFISITPDETTPIQNGKVEIKTTNGSGQQVTLIGQYRQMYMPASFPLSSTVPIG